MDLDEIIKMPTTNENSGKVHESIFRSYHVCAKVLTMVARGDSKETIEEVAHFLMHYKGAMEELPVK